MQLHKYFTHLSTASWTVWTHYCTVCPISLSTHFKELKLLQDILYSKMVNMRIYFITVTLATSEKLYWLQDTHSQISVHESNCTLQSPMSSGVESKHTYYTLQSWTFLKSTLLNMATTHLPLQHHSFETTCPSAWDNVYNWNIQETHKTSLVFNCLYLTTLEEYHYYVFYFVLL